MPPGERIAVYFFLLATSSDHILYEDLDPFGT